MQRISTASTANLRIQDIGHLRGLHITPRHASVHRIGQIENVRTAPSSAGALPGPGSDLQRVRDDAKKLLGDMIDDQR
jgi:hypothetical protein